MLYKRANELIPIEIKSSKTFHTRFLKGVQFLQALLPQRASTGAVIYAGENMPKIQGIEILNFAQASKMVE